MDTDHPLATITKWIANFEARERDLVSKIESAEERAAFYKQRLHETRASLAKMKDLLEAFEADRASVKILSEEPDAALQKERGTHFARIRAFLIAKFNEPQTVAEIEQGTGIARTSLSAVLYRTHSEHFKEDYRFGRRGKVWCLSEYDGPKKPPVATESTPKPEEDIPF